MSTPPQATETKPFYLTSEFWITIATIVTTLAGALPVGGRTATILATVAAAAYTISRGLAKAGVPAVVVAPRTTRR